MTDVEETYGVVVNVDGLQPPQVLAVQGNITDIIVSKTNSYCSSNQTTFDQCCAGFGERCDGWARGNRYESTGLQYKLVKVQYNMTS